MRVLYYDRDGVTFEGLMLQSYGPSAEVVNRKGVVTEEAKPERADIVIVMLTENSEPENGHRLGIPRFDPNPEKPNEVLISAVEAVPVVLLREVPRRDEDHPTESYKVVN